MGSVIHVLLYNVDFASRSLPCALERIKVHDFVGVRRAWRNKKAKHYTLTMLPLSPESAVLCRFLLFICVTY
jgi:hypothetical protein